MSSTEACANEQHEDVEDEDKGVGADPHNCTNVVFEVWCLLMQILSLVCCSSGLQKGFVGKPGNVCLWWRYGKDKFLFSLFCEQQKCKCSRFLFLLFH